MKNLKTLIIIITFLISTGCTKKEKLTEDSIVGIWKIEKTVHIFEDGVTIIEYPTDCFKNSRYEYKPDGNLIFRRTEGKKLGECLERPKDFWTGTWKKISNENFEMYYKIKYSQENISTYSQKTNTFSFSNNNNTLKIYDDYTKSGTPFVETVNGNIVADYSVYKRVQ